MVGGHRRAQSDDGIEICSFCFSVGWMSKSWVMVKRKFQNVASLLGSLS